MWRCTFPLGRVLGIPLRVHPLFLALLALLLAPALREPGALARTSLLVAIAGAGLILHELGHAVVARRQGLPVTAVLLGPFINVTWLAREPASPRDEMCIAAAGPLVNGLLAAGLAVALLPPLPDAARELVRMAAGINLVLCLGNLLPAFPLDGGRLLRAAFARRLPFLVATRLAVRVGNLLVLTLLPVALLLLPALRRPLLLLPLALLAAFLLRMGRREEKAALVRELRHQSRRPEVAVAADLRDRLAAPAGAAWGLLPPGQFRRWQPLCEQAFRRELRAPSRAPG